MVNQKKAKVINILLWIVEILATLSFFVVNYFTESKMGMLRHVVYRNQYYSTIFTKNTLMILTLVVIATFMTDLAHIKKFGLKKSMQQLLGAIILFIAANCINILNPTKITSYYYMIIAIIIVFLCEVSKMLIKMNTKEDK